MADNKVPGGVVVLGLFVVAVVAVVGDVADDDVVVVVVAVAGIDGFVAADDEVCRPGIARDRGSDCTMPQPRVVVDSYLFRVRRRADPGVPRGYGNREGGKPDDRTSLV